MDTKKYGELTIKVEDVKFSVVFTTNEFKVYIHLGIDEVYCVEVVNSMHSKTQAEIEEYGIFTLNQHASIYNKYKQAEEQAIESYRPRPPTAGVYIK